MNALPTIYLDHVILRKLKKEDVDDIYEAFSGVDSMRFRHQRPMKSREEAADLIDKAEKYFNTDTAIRWGVEDIATGKIIGTFLWNFKNGKEQSNIGYSLHPKWWKKDIVEEIFSFMVNDYLWKHDVKTLIAKVKKENKASIKKLEKYGFERFLTEDAHYVYRKFNPSCPKACLN